MTHGLSSPGELDQGIASKGAAYAQVWSIREEIKHKMGEGNPLPILPHPGDRGKQNVVYKTYSILGCFNLWKSIDPLLMLLSFKTNFYSFSAFSRNIWKWAVGIMTPCSLILWPTSPKLYTATAQRWNPGLEEASAQRYLPIHHTEYLRFRMTLLWSPKELKTREGTRGFQRRPAAQRLSNDWE